MTPFEKAQIRLRAWKMLRGWGERAKDGEVSEPWGWDDRLKFAAILADWAIDEEGKDDAEKED